MKKKKQCLSSLLFRSIGHQYWKYIKKYLVQPTRFEETEPQKDSCLSLVPTASPSLNSLSAGCCGSYIDFGVNYSIFLSYSLLIYRWGYYYLPKTVVKNK